MRTWVKLYTDIPDDYKMEQMTDRQFRLMVYAFAHAGKVDEDGRLGPLAEVAWKLRRPEAQVQEDFAALAALHILHEQDGQWYVTHFAERNARPPSDEPEAVRERVGRYRERQKQSNDDVTALQLNGNAEETPLEAEAEAEKKQRQKQQRARAKTPLPAAAIPSDLSLNIAAMFGGIIPPAIYNAWAEHPDERAHWQAFEQTQQRADKPNPKYYLSCLQTALHPPQRNGTARASPKPKGFAGIQDYLEKEVMTDGRQTDRSAGDRLSGRSVPQLPGAK